MSMQRDEVIFPRVSPPVALCNFSCMWPEIRAQMLSSPIVSREHLDMIFKAAEHGTHAFIRMLGCVV